MMWVRLLMLVTAALLAGCGGSRGGGGSEVGNGGDRESVVVEHGLDYARAVLARLEGRDWKALLAEPSGVDADLPWFLSVRTALGRALATAELVIADGLPSFCREATMACARVGETKIYFDRKKLSQLRDYREASGLVIHEAMHLTGECNEARASRAAVLIFKAWKRLGHPEAPHWLSMADAPLAKERIQQDPDLLRFQYTDWTGSRFVVWDERVVQKYDPSLDRWEISTIPQNPFGWRRPKGTYAVYSHSALWVDGHGVVFVPCRTMHPNLQKQKSVGVKVSESTLAWTSVSEVNAPSERQWTAVAKSETQFLVWGGAECSSTPETFSDGAAYTPGTDTWTPIAQDKQTPSPRYAHTAVWAGNAMAVWGGFTVHKELGKPGKAEATNSGAFYDPKAKQWTAMAVDTHTPSPRIYPRLAWSGRELVVFGGFDTFNGHALRSGAFYDPKTRRWRPMPEASRQTSLTAIEPMFTFWTGSQLGFVAREFFAFFDPIREQWNDWGRPATASTSLRQRFYWTGLEAILWDPEERRGVRLYP